jgi:putative transposase
MEVLAAYRFALAPTAAQEQRLLSHCGASRVAFNTMLAAVKANLDQRTAERSYGIAEDELTASLNWSAFALQKEWNRRKDTAAPWWGESSKHAYQSGCNNLARALSNWSKAKAGARRDAVGFPRFKSRQRTTPSCAFSDGVRLSEDRHHVVLPVLGSIRTHHSTRKLARRIEAGTARITGTTVSYRRGRWMVSFTVRLQREIGRPAHIKPGAPVVGVDLGVRDLVVVATPDGREVARIVAPRPLQAAQAKLRGLQRKAARQHGPYDPATKTRREPSAGWRKTQADVAKVHHRVANLRENHLHRVTASLAKRHDVIGVETLAIKPMMARGPGWKKHLNRGIADASMGELLRQLDYKTTWYGSTLVKAPRTYPSSKTCSTCGTVKAKLALNQRTFWCDHCGTRLDRDLNAAINLAHRAAKTTPAAQGESDPMAGFATGRATHKTPHRGAAGDETGTHSDHPTVAGSVTPQGETRIHEASTTS